MIQNTRLCLRTILWPFLRILRLFWRRNRYWFLLKAIDSYDLYLAHLLRHNGSFAAAKQLKGVFNWGKRLSLDLPVLDKYGNHFWVACDRDGFPRRLWRLKVLLMSRSFVNKRIALTVLSGFRLISHPARGRFGSRLDPWTGTSHYLEGILGCLKDLQSWYELKRIRVKSRYDPLSFWVGSGGVMGGRASLSSDYDAWCLLKPKYTLYYKACECLISKWVPAARFRKWVFTVANTPITNADARVAENIAKHVLISEGGSKVRGVTPVNSIIQACLYAYHEYFMTLLRAIPMDCSFNEEKGRSRVQKWTGEGRRLYSYDLSDATDRFPVVVLYVIFKFFLGETLADAWLTLMRLPIRFGHARTFERSFSVGAPMGIYCLWPVFTLCHHCVVQLAAKQAGRRSPATIRRGTRVLTLLKVFILYVIRGDDVVIADEEVAHEYEKIMTGLGLSISESKTFRADRDGPGVAEFAKRIYLRGRDVSPLSVKQFVACHTINPFAVLPLLSQMFSGLDPCRLSSLQLAKLDLDYVLEGFFLMKGKHSRREYANTIIRWLSYAWNRKSRDLLPECIRPPLLFWTQFSQRYIVPAKLAALAVLQEDLRKDLLKERDLFLERVLKVSLSGHSRSWVRSNLQDYNPYFRAINSLLSEIDEMDEGVFDEDPHFRSSRLLMMLRSVKGLGLATQLSRRDNRFIETSRYVRLIHDRISKTRMRGRSRFALEW